MYSEETHVNFASNIISSPVLLVVTSCSLVVYRLFGSDILSPSSRQKVNLRKQPLCFNLALLFYPEDGGSSSKRRFNFYPTTRRHFPENNILRRENLKRHSDCYRVSQERDIE
jgi:hypothetical protein